MKNKFIIIYILFSNLFNSLSAVSIFGKEITSMIKDQDRFKVSYTLYFKDGGSFVCTQDKYNDKKQCILFPSGEVVADEFFDVLSELYKKSVPFFKR